MIISRYELLLCYQDVDYHMFTGEIADVIMANAKISRDSYMKFVNILDASLRSKWFQKLHITGTI